MLKLIHMEDKTLITTAPPPPSEVKIRTMSSDIHSMMQSGGGAPSFQNVSVSGLSLESEAPASTTFISAPMPVAGEIQRSIPEQDAMPASTSPVDPPIVRKEVSNAGLNSDLTPKLIVGLVALIAIGVVGYFAYTIFVK